MGGTQKVLMFECTPHHPKLIHTFEKFLIIFKDDNITNIKSKIKQKCV